ncbi:hypothetical protein ACHAQD_001541 [Fusarium lateritium]
MSSSALTVDPEIDEVYNNTNDFDLANLLYLQNIPNVPAKYQEAVQANAKSVNQWLAWELSRVETTVNSKLKTGALPKDDSLASKFKRTSFRIKVVDVLRKDTAWLAVSGIDSKTIKLTNTEDKLGMAILHAILGIGQFTKSEPALNVIKALGYGFHENSGLVQPHAFYLIDHPIDQVQQTSGPVIKTFTFNVTVTKVQAQLPDPKHKDVKEPEKQSFEAVISYTLSTANINMDLWNRSKALDGEDYLAGKKALLQRQVTLVETDI